MLILYIYLFCRISITVYLTKITVALASNQKITKHLLYMGRKSICVAKIPMHSYAHTSTSFGPILSQREGPYRRSQRNQSQKSGNYGHTYFMDAPSAYLPLFRTGMNQNRPENILRLGGCCNLQSRWSFTKLSR